MLKILLILSPFAFCVLFALIVPFVSPYNATFVELANAKIPPNLAHLFGTDLLGRDLFTQMAYALRVSLFVGFISAFFTLVIAVVFVLVARCSFYSFFIRSLDALLAFPSLLLVMLFQSFLGGNLLTMSFVIALGHFAFIAKLLDSELNSLMKSEFYLCALALGSTKSRAFYKDLLPACVNLLFVLFILNVAHSIGNEATLSFFGLGVGLNDASLGKLLNEGAKMIFTGAWWLIIFPVAFLLSLILPLLAVASSLQDSLEVRID